MPTDSFDAIYGDLFSRDQVDAGTNQYDIATTRFMGILKGVCLEAGWGEMTDPWYAHGTIPLLGAPFVSVSAPPPGGLVHIDCTRRPFLRFYYYKFIPYNEYTEVPDCTDTTAIFFKYGLTSDHTISNLCNAVTSATPYDVIGDASHMDIVAKFPGPTFDYPLCLPDPKWGPASVIQGGGYKIRSNGSGATAITVNMYSVEGNHSLTGPIDGHIRFEIEGTKWDTHVHAEGTEPFYKLTCIAGMHGFCFFDPKNDNHFGRNTSLLVCAPEVSLLDDPIDTYFVVGDKSFRNSTGNWKSCAVWMNDGINRWTDGAYPRPMTLRSPGTKPLLTFDGVPFIQGAYVAYGSFREDQPKVIGRIYDCIISSDYIAPGGVVTLKTPSGTYRFEVISSQKGDSYTTRSSVLWRIA